MAGTGSFRGAIEVRRNGRGLAVVNHLPLEEYVRGIDEVPPSWPAAALQAQAIAARTYAAHKAMAGEARWRAVGADICATPTCQVYKGLDAERRAGMVLTEHGAMSPNSAVSGLILGHPGSSYFAVGRIGRDQLEDYASRKGWSVEEAERWLAREVLAGEVG